MFVAQYLSVNGGYKAGILADLTAYCWYNAQDLKVCHFDAA
ncbi:hypothetical protein imdm_1272 [gamma proteobacterium IMCC2047]|nr:hypothetical protein imdm_1272 [gamma proteobacterium IMCC2047]